MYHDIDAICKKIDIIKEKADKLREGAIGYQDPELTQYEIDDIRALCADIANDRQTVAKKY